MNCSWLASTNIDYEKPETQMSEPNWMNRMWTGDNLDTMRGILGPTY